MDIFGQHEHQSLLHIANHKILIDGFGDAEFYKLKSRIKSNYDEYLSEKNKLEKMDIDSAEKERQIDLLKFQIDEIEGANLSISDDEELENQFNRVNNIKSIGVGVGEVLDSFNGDDLEIVSIIDSIFKNSTTLSNLKKYDSDLTPIFNRVEGVGLELQDINNELQNYMEALDLNEESLSFLTDRINTVNRLKKKYGNTVQMITEFKYNIQDELDTILNYDNEIKRLKENISKNEELLVKLSKELSSKRKKIAKNLETNITIELQELNMENIIFKVSFKESNNITADGTDQIEFLISTNPGEDLKPLSRIISGGEMSRIMLGFKSILAEYDGIPTLIFDEIDTGISGRTAQVVGEKISKISKAHQVISISHLPQIAALADSHYLISKGLVNNKSITTITRLTDDERVVEMARILGGVNVTETTMDHAREMLEMTKKLKN